GIPAAFSGRIAGTKANTSFFARNGWKHLAGAIGKSLRVSGSSASLLIFKGAAGQHIKHLKGCGHSRVGIHAVYRLHGESRMPLSAQISYWPATPRPAVLTMATESAVVPPNEYCIIFLY